MNVESEILYPQVSEDGQIVESMANFHGHMPGGIYRPADSPTQGFIRRSMKEYLEEFAPFIDLEESEWPDGVDRELVKVVKVKRDIQRGVDEILTNNPELAAKWEQNKTLFRGGGSVKLRHEVLRPIYTLLRGRFSEADLSS